MKLSTIAAILTDNIDDIHVSSLNPTPLNTGLTRLNNLTRFKIAIDNLAKTGVFSNIIEELQRHTPILLNSLDTFDLSSVQYNHLQRLVNQIIIASDSLIIAINQAIPEENTNSVSVKLPEFNFIKEFIELLDILERAFSLAIYNNTINGTIIIDSIEPGSKWLNISLGTTAATTLIGALTWSAVVISKQLNENKLAEEKYRTIGLQNDALESIVEAHNKQIEMLVQAEAEMIYNDKFNKTDKEQIGRLKLSIKDLAKLISKGGEIHPSLNTSETIKVEFPTTVPLHLIESKTKRLDQNAGPSSK